MSFVRKLPGLVNNWISGIGAVIASVAFIIIVILLGLDFITGFTNQYLGILAYMVIPPVLIIGLLLMPFGMYLKWRVAKKTGEMPNQKWPYIDFNDGRHQRAAVVFIIGTILFVAMSAYGTYEAFHYSESVAFCGTLCHTVMQPEYVTYKHSPHARVKCTECHVGAGAGWYTKSKLSGAYQVYAVTVNNYPRPIPTPIENLRPARETCEQCHWPEKFFGSQQYQNDHYLYDEYNTHWPINMLMKTGGGDPDKREISGIHWHVSSGYEVEYIARDEDRQDIPWVRLTNRQTGEKIVFQNSDDPLEDKDMAGSEIRRMDCMDCHNRPSHIYNSPDFAVDQYIQFGKISRDLPEIKRVAVEAMAEEYITSEEAMAAIKSAIVDYYAEEHTEIYESDKDKVEAAAVMVQELYSSNIFPEMKARWSDYPNNIGHFYTAGCMRCHEGKHESEQGDAITHDCTACHKILSQGSGEMAQFTTGAEGLEFRHPVDMGEAWREMGCYECHGGTQP